MGKVVKIGAGQGFYGDTIDPAVYLAEHSEVQYICFDTLAELTLAILQKDRQKDSNGTGVVTFNQTIVKQTGEPVVTAVLKVLINKEGK